MVVCSCQAAFWKRTLTFNNSVTQVQLNLHEYTLSHHRRTLREYCRTLVPCSSPVATGGFGGLSSPNKAPSLPNWKKKHYKSMEILSNLNAKPPLHKRKASYWRLSGDGSAMQVYDHIVESSSNYRKAKRHHTLRGALSKAKMAQMLLVKRLGMPT